MKRPLSWWGGRFFTVLKHIAGVNGSESIRATLNGQWEVIQINRVIWLVSSMRLPGRYTVKNDGRKLPYISQCRLVLIIFQFYLTSCGGGMLWSQAESRKDIWRDMWQSAASIHPKACKNSPMND